MSSFFPLQLEVLDVLLVPFLSFMEKILDKVLLGQIKLNMFDVLLRKGTKFLEAKKSGEDVDSGSNIMFFGSIALNMGFAAKFYELGSSSECCQGNWKVMYGLHEEVLKLERDFTSLGIDISMPDVIENDEEEVPKFDSHRVYWSDWSKNKKKGHFWNLFQNWLIHFHHQLKGK